MNKSSTTKKQTAMEKLFQSIKTNAVYIIKIIIRFFILVLIAPLGIVLLVVFTNCCENWLAMLLELDLDSRFIVSFKIILLGLPVFIVLWFFRTWDTKEQLAKSEDQINQNNYFQGLDNLVSKENLKVEIASHQLIALSKVAKKYKEDIQLAFIKRLKSPLNKEEEGKCFSYAQYIVDWLSENYHSIELDLDGCNFDYQEFKIKTNFDIFRNKKNILKLLNFVEANLNEANLYEANLIETNLGGAYLNKANLSETNLSKSYLRKSYLKGACLRGANLNKTNLGGADLFKADLFRANLYEANLSETNLSGANLSEADLSGAILAGAIFNQNQRPIGVNFEELGYKLEPVLIDNTDCYRLVKENN